MSHSSTRPPSIDAVLRRDELANLRRTVQHSLLAQAVRNVLAELRIDPGVNLSAENVASETLKYLEKVLGEFSRHVINATGTVLHTNLGRAPLSGATLDAMSRAGGYTNLEIDLDSGGRGSRQSHVEPLVNLLLGCESSIVVTNNAAGLLLSLRVLASRREIVVSRGQLVEIGDSFRLPDIIRESTARLVEVGTTNRTGVEDYGDAVTSRSAAFLHVHTSNFAQIGFVDSPSIAELSVEARRNGLLLLADNGSGSLVDTAQFGLAHEPTPAEALDSGADLVVFSTDKLLGGPQGGIIAGRDDLVARIRRHALARALRPDKVAIAGLRATLLHYIKAEHDRVPILNMLRQSQDALRVRAEALTACLAHENVSVQAIPSQSTVGGGALPGQHLPSWAIAITCSRPSSLARGLRQADTPVIGRIREGRLLLDLRTVKASQDKALADTVREYLDYLGST